MSSRPPGTSLAYRAAVRLGLALAPAVASRRPKWRDALMARVGAGRRIVAWARENRDPSRALLWMHAPSVGEGLQAEAVLGVLRERHPDWQIVYTHTSPSAGRLAARQPADLADYLPWDLPGEIEFVLAGLAPTALVFCKLDLWPELATRAAARAVAVGLVAATVSPVSSRLRWPARSLLRAGYAAVRAAGAVADDDAERLAALGVPGDAIEITGDPRFDSALHQARSAAGDRRYAVPGDGPALVAGSTWPADEAVLLPAFATVRRSMPEARLILAPHEPTAEHLALVERRARSHGLESLRLSRAGTAGSAALVIVDRVGLLAGLYAQGRIAFVGGGFGRAGLHSVLEPAAAGVPVLFGPHWRNSREAGLLLDAEAATTVDASPPALAAGWMHWLADDGARSAAGARALAVVERGQGGAERNARLVEALVTGGRTAGRPDGP
ncbi:MAG: 3-deoxy-D-manno-octulosonic acid transferase [Gemmatimonadales bacterium]